MENIYNDILELSDINMQKKLWLNENNDTGLISSYVEVMNRLFDDNGFDDFVNKKALEKGLSPSLIFELDKLRGLLNSYSEKKSDNEIIDDYGWKEIVKQAKIIIKQWPK